MSTQQTARPSTLQSVQNIIRKRMRITEAMIGSFIILSVRGNGNVLPVKDKDGNAVPAADGSGQMLEKKIFNLVCNSDIALKNERNQGILREAYAAEKAGDTAKAEELYNDYLNKTQVSINVLSTSALFDRIKDGDQLKGKVQKITSDKGSLLTLDSSGLSIKEAGYGESSDSLDLFAMAMEETAAPAEGTTVNTNATASASA